MNDKNRHFNLDTKPRIGELPRVTPSLPPKDIVNKCFHRSTGENPTLFMERDSLEAYRIVMKKLEYYALERAPEYAKFEENDPERLRFELRRWIVVYLSCSTSDGQLSFNDFMKKISGWTHLQPPKTATDILPAFGFRHWIEIYEMIKAKQGQMSVDSVIRLFSAKTEKPLDQETRQKIEVLAQHILSLHELVDDAFSKVTDDLGIVI